MFHVYTVDANILQARNYSGAWGSAPNFVPCHPNTHFAATILRYA